MHFDDFEQYCAVSAHILTAMNNAELLAHIQQVLEVTVAALRQDLPLLVCGNGGSAADAQHIVTELVQRFMRKRQAIAAICLGDNVPLMSAIGNDDGFDRVFSRQVEAFARKGGVLWVLSTSGHSANVLEAAKVARMRKMTVVAFSGKTGGELLGLADHAIRIPTEHVPLIQQGHQCVYHYLCGNIEQQLLKPE